MKKIILLLALTLLSYLSSTAQIKEIKRDFNYIVITDTITSSVEWLYPAKDLRYIPISSTDVVFYDKNDKRLVGSQFSYHVDSLVSETKQLFTITELETFLRQNTAFNSAGATALTTKLVHLVIIGQSQAGGYNSVPSLSSSTNKRALTLTDGVLDANTLTGDLIMLQEGDTYDNGGSSTNVETMATSLAQQLASYVSDTTYRFVVTIHYEGGTTIQQLSSGGAAADNGYDAAIESVSRVSTIAADSGYVYSCHLLWNHGGSGVNDYGSAFASLVSDFRTDIQPYYTGTSYVWCDQMRVIGSPDYGIQLYEQSLLLDNVKVLLPRKGVVAYQGDGVHLTNHGTRNLAMYYATAIYDDLFLTNSHNPLIIDQDNITYNPSDSTFTVPLLHYTGSIVGSGDFNTIVYDVTNSQAIVGSWSVSGSNILFKAASNIPIGTVDLEFRTGQGTGFLRDSRQNTNIVFNDGSSSPYTTYKYIVRANFEKTIDLPLILYVNMGGLGTAPTVTGWESIIPWQGASSTASDYVFSDIGGSGISITLVNNGVGDRWGFANNNGTYAGNAGFITGNDSGIVPDNVLLHYVFIESASPDMLITGLDDSKTYKIEVGGSRDASGTRLTNYTIGVTTLSAEAIDNTSDQSIFTGISPIIGTITMTVANNNNVFGYLGWVKITEE